MYTVFIVELIKINKRIIAATTVYFIAAWSVVVVVVVGKKKNSYTLYCFQEQQN
jgi:hypothetical protein